MRGTVRFSTVLCSIALAACSVEAPILSPDAPAFAKAPTSLASLSDGVQTSGNYAVKVFDASGGGFRLDAQEAVTAVISLDATAAATTTACWAGAYGADSATMAALLGKLESSGTNPLYTLITEVRGNNTGHIVLRWQDSEGDFFVRFGVTTNAPSVDPAVTTVGNAYTYSGGTVYILRTSGVKGSKTNPQTKRDMVCPNEDQVILTFPAA